MPELPEVETIVRDLNKNLKNKKIIGLKSFDGKVVRLTPGQRKNIIGSKIRSIRRRAKMIIMDLGDNFIIIHLKMTGQLVLQAGKIKAAGGHPILNQSLPNKFSRAIFKLSDQSLLYFNDIRRFGWIKLFSPKNYLNLLAKQGIEPLSRDFTLANFQRILLSKKNSTIKQALLDQKKISGIGNIYADESLFNAGIKPFRRVKTLTAEETARLWLSIPKILSRAIKYRGTSFNDYVDARGRSGNFIKYLRVYGRAGEDCFNCHRPIKKLKLGGRGTHWCDYCQR